MDINIFKSLETYCQIAFQKRYPIIPPLPGTYSQSTIEHLVCLALGSSGVWPLVTGKMDVLLGIVMRDQKKHILALTAKIKQQLHILGLLM